MSNSDPVSYVSLDKRSYNPSFYKISFEHETWNIINLIVQYVVSRFLICNDIELLIEHINLVLVGPDTICQHQIIEGPKDIAFPVRAKGTNKL
jgi:hypothetical protein